MSVFHDEVEIEDFEFDEETRTYYYPCPCGDLFQITKVTHTLSTHFWSR
jgi:diphthamide biosynthesis protein 3